jgi:D-alanyl-D-alanine carboxypeptidase/D-alanyl-D-alanine-endopeptidase (penicillin-binding protein 4)
VLLLVLSVLLAAATGLLQPPAAAANVSAEIDAILAARGVVASDAGIFIWDIDAARKVFALNAGVPLTPASNMKLVTTAAALTSWGAEHRFTTLLYVRDDRIIDGRLPGNLYLRGGGDPSLSTRSYQRDELDFKTASFETFARNLRAIGVHTVGGRVIGDESWFDEERRVSEWKPGFEEWCGPLSALSGNEGLQDGDPVDAPATYSAKLLTEALRKAGIKIKGKPGAGQVPAGALLIQRQSSAPLRVLLKRQNKESDNLFAETILKGLGKDFQDLGSTAAGALVSGATLGTMDIAADAYVIQDGSGLSYGDRLTPYAIVRLLGAMYQRPDFGVFYDSLAIAGKDGTLKSRMRKSAAAGNARAKTGTLNVATSLAGYVRSANDHLVAFSILVTGDPVDVERANKAQDEIVVALAEAHLAGKRVLSVTPMLRQRPASSVAPINTVGRALQPCVQP